MIKQESQTLIPIRSNFLDVRKLSQKIVSPLELEDFGIQAIEDVSPVKWHLAHTSWFFEAFILIPYDSSYQVFHPKYDHLFNSYYVTHGEPFERSSRGNLSRPTVHEVMEYRHYIDEQITRLLDHASDRVLDEILPIIEVGIHHEQQHQELMLTDIKYNFSVNPMRPVYQMKPIPVLSEAPERKWVDVAEGLTHIGHQGDDFSYDNEQPRHKVWLDKYQISSRPVTNGEYIQFIEDGGYQTAEHWLSEGWSIVEDKQWKAPLYWEKMNGVWHHYMLSGFFDPEDAKLFLKRSSTMLDKGDGLLIGVDLKKDPNILNQAYNDKDGVTAEFNLNVLKRINQELNANFDLDLFSHLAFYNGDRGRIEMHIQSLANQTVSIKDETFTFSKDETIHTENSYKYTIDQFQSMAEESDFTSEQVWTDPNEWFSVHYLQVV